MLKKWKQFYESNNTNNQFHGDYYILDVFDPEDDGYVEYITYNVLDKKFYFLDPDFDIIIGPIDSLDKLMTNVGIDSDNYNEYLDKIKNL